MHFLKQFGAGVILGALSANIAAAPAPAPAPAPAANASPDVDFLEPREDLTDHLAIVNFYSGGSCSGDTSQVSATGPSTSMCYANSGESIQVTARYVFLSYIFSRLGLTMLSGCSTSTWSGSGCAGSSMNIPDSSCYTVTYTSVLVSC